MTVSSIDQAERPRAGVVARRPLVRDALALLLGRSSIDVIASVGSILALDEADPDGLASVALLVMPDDSGVGVVPARSGHRWADSDRLDQLIVVIDWDARPDDLLGLVRAPFSRRYPIPRSIPTADGGCGSSTRVGLSDLTDREIGMLTMLAEGRSATEAANLLGISPHTARTHIANVLRKLRVHSRLEAVSVTRGLLQAELEFRGVAV